MLESHHTKWNANDFPVKHDKYSIVVFVKNNQYGTSHCCYDLWTVNPGALMITYGTINMTKKVQTKVGKFCLH